MYFLGCGTLGYMFTQWDTGAQIKKKVEDHQWCSEAALWMDWIHRGQMKAVSHADLCMLKAKMFIDLTCQSEDVYKFCRAHALFFHFMFDSKEATDISAFRQAVDGQDLRHPQRSDALERVRAAEDAEVHMIHFDLVGVVFLFFSMGHFVIFRTL